MEEFKDVFHVTGKLGLQYECLCKLRGLELVFYTDKTDVEVWKITDLQTTTMTTHEAEDRSGFTFLKRNGNERKMFTADRRVYSRWKDELLFIMANIAERGSSVNPHPEPKFDSSKYPVRPKCYLCQNKSKMNCAYCKNSCCWKCVGKSKIDNTTRCYLCLQAQTYLKLSTAALKSVGMVPPSDKDALMLCREELVKKRDRRLRKVAAIKKENTRRHYDGSSFIDACNAADLINIKSALAAGQDVNMLDEKGSNCILILCSKNWAAQKVDLNEVLLCLQYLLSRNANANARDSSYKTPLHWCCEKGYHLFIPDLLRNGAKTTSQNLESENAWDIAFSLKQEACVKTLDEFDTQVINDWKDKKKRRTCFEKYPALALNYKTLEGDTLLHIAAKNNDNELITDLINAGAKFNAKNYSGHTFFNNTILFGDDLKNTTATIDLVMKLPTFNASASDYYGLTYLHYAAFKDKDYIIQQLLKCRASPLTVDKIFNGTPLHVAFAANKQRAVAALMVYRILPTLANNQGKLPDSLCTNKSTLTNIAKNNTILDTIEAGQKPLIPVTVDAYDVKDYAENSIFHYAMNFGSDDLSNQYAKEAQGRKVELKNYKGQTVEDVTHLGGDMTIMSSIKAYSSILPNLLSQVSLGDDLSVALQDYIAQKHVGAMINHRFAERQYKTVLHIAVESNFVECVRVLSTQVEASLAVQDQNGQTPLHLACILGLNACMLTMLDSLAFNKSCLDVKDNKGNTALLLSCQPSDNEATMTGKKICTKLLLEKGADSKILNNDGKCAKDFATDTEVLRRLGLLSHFDELTEAIKSDNLTAFVDVLKGKEVQWKIDLLNTRDSNGRNFLIVAVDLQRPMFVKVLVKEGASMDMPDNEGRTARKLLEHQESNSNSNLKAVDDYDYRRQEEFIEMCANGRTNEVEEILQMNPKYVQSSLRSGETPLYCAAVGGIPSREAKLRKNGFPEVIKVLAKYGAETNRRVFTTGDTALHGACYWANPGCVEQLLIMGCDTSITNMHGKTAREVIPLSLAEVDKRSTHFVEGKITEEDISQIFEFLQESSLFDRLLMAASRGRDEMKRVAKEIYRSNVPEYAQQQVKPLLDDRKGNPSPREVATTESNTNVRPSMIEKRELLMHKQTVASQGVISYDRKQASVKRIFNMCNKSGNTILHIYVEQLNVDVVSFFLENHADPLKPNKDGLKPSQILTKLEDIIDESDKRRNDLFILRERLKAWENFHHFVNLLQKKDFDKSDELQFGQELTFAGPNGFTLLHWAVLRKREVAVKILTENKSPMKKDRNGNTPIHWAAILGHDFILSILLESLDNDSKKTLINQPNDQNFTPLLLCCLFQGAAYNNCIKSLLDIANKFLALRKDLLSPLIMCAVSENYDIMIKLLEQGFDPNVQDSRGQTPLLLAIYQGSNAEVLTELIEKGASINVPDEDGYTPLMLACKKGNPRNVNILLSSKKELELTSRNTSNGWSAVHFAVHSGIMAIVLALINKEANIVNEIAENGYAPLHIALMTENMEMIKFLVLNGADVRVTLDILGFPLELDEVARIVEEENTDLLALVLSGQLWRSLIDAAKRGWTKELNVTVSALSELAPLGSDLFTINTADPTANGQTALHFACKNGDTANVKTLLQHNVDTSVKDVFGKCAIDYCDQSPDIKELLEQKDKCTQLLDFAIACTKKRQSDADCAIELEELLNKLPGVLNAINSFGDFRLHPIHEFAKKGYEACCRVLVTAKRECIRLKDKDGNTPVHLAVLNGQLAVLALLCSEADIAWLEMRNNRGLSPLELAREEVIARDSQKHKNRALECANLLAKYTNDDSASEDESSSESESSSSDSDSESEKKKKRKAKKKKKAKKVEKKKTPAKDKKDVNKSGPEKKDTATEKKDGEQKDDAKKDDKKDDDKKDNKDDDKTTDDKNDKGKSEKNSTESSQTSSPKNSRKKKDKSIESALEKFKVLYKRHKHQNDENKDKGRIIEKGLSEWKKSKEEFNERTNATSKRDEVKKIRELVGKIRVSSNLTQIEEHCIALVALLDRLR